MTAPGTKPFGLEISDAGQLVDAVQQTYVPYIVRFIEHGFDVAPALMAAVAVAMTVPLVALASRIGRWARWRSPERTVLLNRRRTNSPRGPRAHDLLAGGAVPPAGYMAIEPENQTGKSVDNWGGDASRAFFAIGRDDTNDIIVRDRSVHRNHAAIYRDEFGRYLIADLSHHQGNGVTVNGEPYRLAPLADGDIIELGRERVIFRMTPI